MSRCVRSVTSTTAALALSVVLWPADAQAQPRGHARPRVTPTHVRPAVYRPYYSRYYYSPYYYPYSYYSPFYFSFGAYWGPGWGPYGWYPSYYGQYPYPPYAYGHYYDESSLRVQVKPNDAEVYIDGHFVGQVDSYDGMFQRLHVRPGEHVVEIFREGYRPIRESMRFVPREGYELKREMQPLTPGDPAPVRPKPDPAARPADEEAYERRPQRNRVEPSDRPRDERGSDAGAVAIRVQPVGAIVLIDGEKWEGPEGPDRLVVHLTEGTHRVEIQKEGYRPFVTEVRIRRGETVPLNVSLRTGG